MNNKTLVMLGAICLLAVGLYFGSYLNKKTDDTGKIATVTGTPTLTATKGTVGGFLTYPGEGIPPEVGVCAENIANPKLVNCVSQIKDKKYETGVGYQMDLEPGNYYVYAFYKDMKAYYDEFVICGLKESCKSHTKIPVVVTAGSVQDQILPHDWYNETTPTATVKPTATPTTKPIAPVVSIVKINPNILKLIPSNTPTPTTIKIVIPSIKINIPQW